MTLGGLALPLLFGFEPRESDRNWTLHFSYRTSTPGLSTRNQKKFPQEKKISLHRVFAKSGHLSTIHS